MLDTLKDLDWRWTPLDLLHTEREYPGLMTDLAIEAWQRRIIREQMKGGQNGNEEPG